MTSITVTFELRKSEGDEGIFIQRFKWRPDRDSIEEAMTCLEWTLRRCKKEIFIREKMNDWHSLGPVFITKLEKKLAKEHGMPWVSKKQRAWAHATKQKFAPEWDAATPKGAKLPARVKKKRASAKRPKS